MIEYLRFSIRNLSYHKARTLLTLLGMIIGVAVIIAMVSIGKGMDVSINEQLEKMGGDKITIMPAGMRYFSSTSAPREYVAFTQKELSEIKRIPGVKDAVPYFMRNALVEYRNEKKEVSVAGGTRKGYDVFRAFYTLKKGRLFEDSESNVVVLGYRVWKDEFDNEIRVGDIIKIKGKKFKVIGLLEEIGNRGDDTTIYMPLKAAQALFDAENEISMIFVVAESEEIVNNVAKKIEDKLEKLRGTKDFEVLTSENLAKQIAQVTNIITFVLGGIASVSLLVGGIIIMNTMLMNVIERTREIGIMKATGAKSRTILLIFLVEAMVIGMVGGSIGIGLGYIISKIIETIGKFYIGGGFITVINIKLVVGAMCFSIFVGIISGVYPAYKAAKLDPIEALRFE